MPYKRQWKEHLRGLEGNFTSACTSSWLTMLPAVSSSSIKVGGTESSMPVLAMSISSPESESSANVAATASSTEKCQH